MANRIPTWRQVLLATTGAAASIILSRSAKSRPSAASDFAEQAFGRDNPQGAAPGVEEEQSTMADTMSDMTRANRRE